MKTKKTTKVETIHELKVPMGRIIELLNEDQRASDDEPIPRNVLTMVVVQCSGYDRGDEVDVDELYLRWTTREVIE